MMSMFTFTHTHTLGGPHVYMHRVCIAMIHEIPRGSETKNIIHIVHLPKYGILWATL